MVVSFIAGALLAAAPKSVEVEPKIVAVSMFKNGFTLVARQIEVPSSGSYETANIPRVVYGTFWHVGTNGMKVSSVLAGTRERVVTQPAQNLDQVLAFNEGKTVTVDLIDLPSVTGVLKVVTGDYFVIDTGGESTVVHRSRVKRLSVKGGAVWTRETKESQRVLQFNVEAPRGGVLTTFSIERGMAWLPAYQMDITDPKNVKVSVRATIVNDLADLNGAMSSLITGFPNLTFAHIEDPLTAPGGLDDLIRQFASGAMNAPVGMMNQMAKSEMQRDAAPPPAPIEMGEGQLEDLFFYKGPVLDLKRGDRANFELFGFEAPCEHLYTWDVQRGWFNTDIPQETWHVIRFKNTSNQPLTTGAATTVQQNQVLSQDMLRYVSKGGTAELRLTKALDIQTNGQEEEIGRERQNYKVYSTYYDLVTVKGTLTIVNRKPEEVSMRVRHSFQGEMASSEGSPKVTKVPTPQAQLNPTTMVEWSLKLPGGATRKIEYTYKMYVPSNG